MVLHRDSTQPVESLDPADAIATPEASVPMQGPGDETGLTEVLQIHGFGNKLIEKLVGFATAPTHVKRPVDRLAIALGAQFNFFSLEDVWTAPILLCGLAGAGISTITAKLVARFDESEVMVIAAGQHDAEKIEELRGNLEALDLPLTLAPNADAMRQAIASANGRKIVIDVAGSPLLDRKAIQEFASAAGAVGMLVTSAEASDADTLAAAGTASALGFTRMIVTRLDSARYLGAALNAADSAKMALVSGSITPHFGFGLRAISPENLARRLVSAAAHPERWRAAPL
jgi:flagellar biosynthesis GTPase FlhF